MRKIDTEALTKALGNGKERENSHSWELTGMIPVTFPAFPEKRCKVCGVINWGAREGSICLGMRSDE